jgi:hypothetical protein
MNMQIIYKNKEAEKKRDLIERINGLMGSPNCDLCILFATEDNNNKPQWKAYNVYDDRYNDQGFYVNIDVDGIPCPEPDEVRDCLCGKFCKHFIWISKGICEAEHIHFAWVYSHELQHLRQSLNNPFLLIVAELLDDLNSDVQELDIPSEYDCERKAKEIVITLFGEDECASYLRRMRSEGAANDKRYNKLLALSIMADFDVERDIQQHIRVNKKLFMDIQKKRCDQACTNWDIDIDKLCSYENAHEAIISSVKRIV